MLRLSKSSCCCHAPSRFWWSDGWCRLCGTCCMRFWSYRVGSCVVPESKSLLRGYRIRAIFIGSYFWRDLFFGSKVWLVPVRVEVCLSDSLAKGFLDGWRVDSDLLDENLNFVLHRFPLHTHSSFPLSPRLGRWLATLPLGTLSHRGEGGTEGRSPATSTPQDRDSCLKLELS